MGHPNAISLFDVTSRYPMPPLLNATSKVGSRLSFKFVVPYEKIFATFPRMPYRRRSSSMCSAIGTDGFRCNETSLEGRWCIRHQEQRVKLYSNFKACRTAIENFPQGDLERDVTRIRTLEASLAKKLCDVLRRKRWLVRECLDAHECFWTRFYGDDMDFGSHDYGHTLKRRFNEVEALLFATEEHLQEMLLSDMGAFWILDRKQPSGQVSQFLEACCEYPEVVIEEAEIPTPKHKKLTPVVIPDPVKEALKQKRYAMIIGIWDYIARMCTPPESQFFEERLAIIHAHIARCILTDATLVLAVQQYTSVEDFLQDLDQDIYVWERLMNLLSQPNVHCVRAAIDDVLRSEDVNDEYVTFLGGRLYRKLSGASFLPFRAWSHWAVFFPSSCLCAVRKAFSSAEAISLSSKFMQLHGVIPPSEYSKSISANIEVLNLCGIHLNQFDHVGVRHSRQKRTTPDGSPLWVETQNAISFTGSMAIEEPISPLFISACMRHPDLMMKIRKGGTEGNVDFPEDLWSSRTRSASSCMELESAPWMSTSPSDTIFNDVQHNLSTGMPLKDCLDFVVLDSTDCDFEEALGKLATICLGIHGVKDLCGLYERYTMSYLKEGELQVDKSGELMPINCAPEETWLMRMHLLGVVLPGREEDQARFEKRFLVSS
ncbi:hypothetical protein E1B28_006307 [Marasmius oreades]|uniref:Uncharacterized protein n=1 Tax=Marasmius oreades TaxID=181124 RepID=A0A9P7S513_9AGAR|nr:uncharacterized protein E1B28_006307 [Marasmius oreades]KAG7095574.1 hypothetical protein E1B28_006307 [Marasmius oreades]